MISMGQYYYELFTTCIGLPMEPWHSVGKPFQDAWEAFAEKLGQENKG